MLFWAIAAAWDKIFWISSGVSAFSGTGFGGFAAADRPAGVLAADCRGRSDQPHFIQTCRPDDFSGGPNR